MDLTPAQKQALEDVHEKLAEHFEGHVLIVRLHDDISHQEDYRLNYSGGGYQALGMVTKAQAAMSDVRSRVETSNEDSEF